MWNVTPIIYIILQLSTGCRLFFVQKIVIYIINLIDSVMKMTFLRVYCIRYNSIEIKLIKVAVTQICPCMGSVLIARETKTLKSSVLFLALG